MSKRYESIDGLRTYAMLGIVMMHIFANGKYEVSGFLFTKIIPAFTNFVFLFMTVSAFGLCCGYYDKFMKRQIDVVDFYRKRYKKILPFFALLSFLDLILGFNRESLFEAIANVTLCFGLLPNANISVIGVGWFLGLIFVFYFMFPFFVSLLADKKTAWLALVVSYIMNLLCRIYFMDNSHVNSGYSYRTNIVYCFVFFVIGGLIFLYRDVLRSNARIKWFSLIGLIISIVCYLFVNSGVETMLVINAMLLIWAISGEENRLLDNKMTHYLGALSFEIYLCHMLVYRVIEKMHLLHVFSNEYVNYFMTIIMVLSGAVIFTIVIKKITNVVQIKITNKRSC